MVQMIRKAKLPFLSTYGKSHATFLYELNLRGTNSISIELTSARMQGRGENIAVKKSKVVLRASIY
jgi:hypothetical protein